jgi:hypothetical protein
MFRVSLFCDDKKLAEILRGLTGLAIGSPEVAPVVNGAKQNGKAVAAGNGDLFADFDNYVKKHKLKEITPAGMKMFAREIGRAESSHTYFAKRLVNAHLLKKTGKGAKVVYVVTGK